MRKTATAKTSGNSAGSPSKHPSPSQRVEKKLRPKRKVVKVVRLGNCRMCSEAGPLGQRCANGCRETDPLANEDDGRGVRQDRSTIVLRGICICKAMQMPDDITMLDAQWYQYVIEGTGPE
jgi:hypothetical protein